MWTTEAGAAVTSPVVGMTLSAILALTSLLAVVSVSVGRTSFLTLRSLEACLALTLATDGFTRSVVGTQTFLTALIAPFAHWTSCKTIQP